MKTIAEFLVENKRRDAVSFHMPGHKGRSDIFERAGYGEFLRGMISEDITEIPGADALYCPETTIKAVMDNYAELYGVKHTELLVNGSSAGVMAAVLACVPRGGKLILGRNSHHSAFSALRLGGIKPVYVAPEINGFGLQAEISPETLKKACRENPDASAVLITSPNYYGALSDIGELADISHDRGMLLIVDQAHGAHLKFFDDAADAMKRDGEYVRRARHAAENLGADIVINSTHKTLLSFTGSGILNICSDDVSEDAVADYLRMLQTTSPSYLLMGSLDLNEKIMREHGPEIVSSWQEDLVWFYRHASRIPGVTLIGGSDMTGEDFAMYREKAGMDLSKINISMAKYGITGDRLNAELRHRSIISELVHGEYVLLMTGVGNARSDYEKLLDAVRAIADDYGYGADSAEPASVRTFNPELAEVPKEAETIPLYEADGRVVYDPVIIYPPGSPIICPGEVMNMEVIGYIAGALNRGEKVAGVDEEGLVKVGIEF